MSEATSKPATRWWPLPNPRLPFQHLPFSRLATTALSAGSRLPSSTSSLESHHDDALATQSEVAQNPDSSRSLVEQVEVEDEDTISDQAAVDAQLHEELAMLTAGEMYPPSVHAMRLRSAASKAPEMAKAAGSTKAPETVKTAGSKKLPKKAHWKHLKYTVIGSKRLRERYTVNLDDLQLGEVKQTEAIHTGLAKVENYAALFREQLARPEIPGDLNEKCKEELKELSKIIERSEQVINEATPAARKAQGTASQTGQPNSHQRAVHSQSSMTTRPVGLRRSLDVIKNGDQPLEHPDLERDFLNQLETAVQNVAAPTAMSMPKNIKILTHEYKVTTHDLELGLQFTLESSRATREDCEQELHCEMSVVAPHVAILQRKSSILSVFAERMAGHPRVQARVGDELAAIAGLVPKAYLCTKPEKVIEAERQLVEMDKRNDAPSRRLRRGCMPVGRIVLSDEEEELTVTAPIRSEWEARDRIWVASSEPEELAVQRNIRPTQVEADQAVLPDLLSEDETDVERELDSEVEEIDMMDYELVEMLP